MTSETASQQFNHLNLHPELVQAVIELGYTTPMPIQTAVIPAMLAGCDIIGQAQTGTGKTAAFALPMLQNLIIGDNHVQGLVLAPTRELALQVAEAITDYGRFQNPRVLAVYGGQPYGPQISQIRRGVDIVVGTPGRLLDLIHKGILDISKVSTVVLDEADEMLSMGFIEDIEAILSETPSTRQTTLFSATLPAEIRRLADRYLHSPQSITIHREQVTGETIVQRYYMVNRNDKLAAITRLFEIEEVTSALIFVRTRSGTGDLANELTRRGFPAEALNGDLSQDARERTLNRFRQNQIKVLVATDVAARGLDIDDISHVFNFDLPEDPELYVHRIGRTGRAGKAGLAISIITPAERRRLGQIEAFTHQKLTRATLPTDEDIYKYREELLLGRVNVWLQRGRCQKERDLVERLVETGHDPIEIAAAALKLARSEEKQRPIVPMSSLPEPSSYASRERGPRPERGGYERGSDRRGRDGSHEAGMVRLSVDAGRRDGLRPNDIVGAIASHANIPGSVIGKILIHDQHALVDVPEDYVAQVLAMSREIRFRKQPLKLQRA